MSLPKPIRIEPKYEQSSFNLACLVQKAVGVELVPITQADLESIELKVYDSSDPSTLIAEVELEIADVIFDELQEWPQDDVGYNFLLVTDPDHVPNGGREYHFELTFSPPGGYPFPETFVVPTVGRASV